MPNIAWVIFGVAVVFILVVAYSLCKAAKIADEHWAKLMKEKHDEFQQSDYRNGYDAKDIDRNRN